MRVVVDAIPVRFGGFAVALEALLEGWTKCAPGDELHVVADADAELVMPAEITSHAVRLRAPRAATRAAAQNLVLPRVVRSVRPDALLAVLPSTAVVPVGVPKVVIVHDLRHEMDPQGFSSAQRRIRSASYAIGYRQAAALACVSQRTRADLLRLHPGLVGRAVAVTAWGADHVDTWSQAQGAEAGPGPATLPYALAFGHFANKGVVSLISAWESLVRREVPLRLVIVGVPREARAELARQISTCGLEEMVSVCDWLAEDEFRATFRAAEMIVFPSRFEGYGLPAVEAMRLGKRLVISPDPALLEVTGGHAAVMRDLSPTATADAVQSALARTVEELRSASDHVRELTWERTAEQMRALISRVTRSCSDPEIS